VSDETWTIQDSSETYFLENWSEDYFGINSAGNMFVSPLGPENSHLKIEIKSVIEEMKRENIAFPAVLRFHDILHSQVKKINNIFNSVIKEAEYFGEYCGVYPIKVNQMREVVEEIVVAGREFNFGLEAGSKPELMAVLAHNTTQNSLIIVNGNKDDDFIRLALLGNKIGKKVVVVIENVSEVKRIARVSKEMNIRPIIGVRSKMSVRGRGKWCESCGETAKFGLTVSEIINTIDYLEKESLLDCLKLFHFHIGSQITDIRSIKDAISEGGRIYAKLVQMGVPIDYFDVGGGLGIDYDGSQSTNDSSKNYNITEYVSDIVYSLKQICELENVPHPHIVTESGRALTAHHSFVVTEVVDELTVTPKGIDVQKTQGEHILVENMRDIHNDLSKKNFLESYSDANNTKEDAFNAFKLGVISLRERAVLDTLYWKIMTEIKVLLKNADFISEELQSLNELLAPKYMCNFSVFQSAVDTWAIKQLLPIMPVSRLDEVPSKDCKIVDITCDSDGKIDQFIDKNGPKKTLPLHPLNDEEYYLGIFLTGAYQDVMGDMHNLFGRLNEVHVFEDESHPQNFYIEEVVSGAKSSDILKMMQYNAETLAVAIKKEIDLEIQNGNIQKRHGAKLVDFYEECLIKGSYLRPEGATVR
jgi:arginine decarboxylase